MPFPADLQIEYTCLGELGRGGMGVVYRAAQRKLGRHVAIKVLESEVDVDIDIEARFLEEGRLAARIRHPNVAVVLESGHSSDGTLYTIFEFVEGDSLQTIIDRRGALPPTEAVECACGILSGLEAIHTAGILHRDIKPANVMVMAGNVPKILDFGIARDLLGGKHRTRTGVVLGTPEYMAPEIVLGEQAAKAADIYSTGVLLYHLLTGRLPFEGDTLAKVLKAHLDAAPLDPLQLKPRLPAPVAALVLQALAKRPKDRPATAAGFAEALSAALVAEARPIAPPVRGPARASGSFARGRVSGIPATAVRFGRDIGPQPAVATRGMTGAARLVVLAVAAAVLVVLGFWAVWRRTDVDRATVPAGPSRSPSPPEATAQATARPLPGPGEIAGLRSRRVRDLETLTSFDFRMNPSPTGSKARLKLLTELTESFGEIVRAAPATGPADAEARFDGLAALVVSNMLFLEAWLARSRLVGESAVARARAAFSTASIHAILGQKRQARQWYERALGERGQLSADETRIAREALASPLQPAQPTDSAAAARSDAFVDRLGLAGQSLTSGDDCADRSRIERALVEGAAALDGVRPGTGKARTWGHPRDPASLAALIWTFCQSYKLCLDEGAAMPPVLPIIRGFLARHEESGIDDPNYWYLLALAGQGEKVGTPSDRVLLGWAVASLTRAAHGDPTGDDPLNSIVEVVTSYRQGLAAVKLPATDTGSRAFDHDAVFGQLSPEKMREAARKYPAVLVAPHSPLMPLLGIAMAELGLRLLESRPPGPRPAETRGVGGGARSDHRGGHPRHGFGVHRGMTRGHLPPEVFFVSVLRFRLAIRRVDLGLIAPGRPDRARSNDREALRSLYRDLLQRRGDGLIATIGLQEWLWDAIGIALPETLPEVIGQHLGFRSGLFGGPRKR
ncbi:MAG: protein kinase [Candidatus Riflebacteria bacterium]|nr:protein kinase [Candidatus Riflebacteria bacterium]